MCIRHHTHCSVESVVGRGAAAPSLSSVWGRGRQVVNTSTRAYCPEQRDSGTPSRRSWSMLQWNLHLHCFLLGSPTVSDNFDMIWTRTSCAQLLVTELSQSLVTHPQSISIASSLWVLQKPSPVSLCSLRRSSPALMSVSSFMGSPRWSFTLISRVTAPTSSVFCSFITMVLSTSVSEDLEDEENCSPWVQQNRWLSLRSHTTRIWRRINTLP